MGSKHRGDKKEQEALSALINLARCAESVLDSTNQPLRDEGLTSGQFGVLEALYHLGPMSQCEIARKLLRTGGNVTTVVDNLEQHGLVQRQQDPSDRRVWKVELTKAGKAKLGEIFPVHAKRVAEAFSVLGLDEISVLRNLCKKLGLAQNKTKGN